jgi:hypothetical protein
MPKKGARVGTLVPILGTTPPRPHYFLFWAPVPMGWHESGHAHVRICGHPEPIMRLPASGGLLGPKSTKRNLFQSTPRISAWPGWIRILIVRCCAKRDALQVEVHVLFGKRATKNHGATEL